MELDAFRSRLGTGQGRVIDASGDAVFVLGELEPGRAFELAPGDHAEVMQDADLTGVDLVRAELRLRVPASMPSGLAWEVSILVNGVKVARTLGWPGETRTLSDLAANVSKLDGVHTVGVRLELVEL